MNINITPVLPITNIRDEDLYNLSLTFGGAMPWLDTILCELQTGRDNSDDNESLSYKNVRLYGVIADLQDENLELSKKLTELQDKLAKVEVIY